MEFEIWTTLYTVLNFLVLLFIVYMIIFFIRLVKKRQQQLNRIEKKLDRLESLREKQE